MLLLQITTLALLALVSRTRMVRQYVATKAALEQAKPMYLEISSYIERNLPEAAPILVFETNYTFLSSHPPAGTRGGSFFVDSYGEMLYRNLGIADDSIPNLLRAWPRQERVTASTVFHRERAQREVVAAFDQTPYVVLDNRALKQLTPETSAYIRTHSQVLRAAGGSELRARWPE